MKRFPFLNGLLSLALILLLVHRCTSDRQSPAPKVKIHYLGHSAFVMQFDNGVTVVTDYGHENAWVDYGWDSPIEDIGDCVPDVMTYSHHHDDHYDPDRIPRNVPHILTGLDSLSIRGITIEPVRTSEDSLSVESNTSYLFTYRGMRICHLADAQAQIMNIGRSEVRNALASVFPDTFDLLLMTIEGKQPFIPQAEAFIDFLHPRAVIPMHYWSEAYKNGFLDYLRAQNDSGKTYGIQVSRGAGYACSVPQNTDSIRVICLTRAPFRGE